MVRMTPAELYLRRHRRDVNVRNVFLVAVAIAITVLAMVLALEG